MLKVTFLQLCGVFYTEQLLVRLKEILGEKTVLDFLSIWNVMSLAFSEPLLDL